MRLRNSDMRNIVSVRFDHLEFHINIHKHVANNNCGNLNLANARCTLLNVCCAWSNCAIGIVLITLYLWPRLSFRIGSANLAPAKPTRNLSFVELWIIVHYTTDPFKVK